MFSIHCDPLGRFPATRLPNKAHPQSKKQIAAADAEDTAADARGLTPTEFGAEDAPGPEDEAEEEAEEEAEKEDDEDEDDEEGDANEEEDKEAAENAGPDAAEQGDEHEGPDEDEDDADPATVH